MPQTQKRLAELYSVYIFDRVCSIRSYQEGRKKRSDFHNAKIYGCIAVCLLEKTAYYQNRGKGIGNSALFVFSKRIF